jgi:hypothetical protein
MYLVAGQRRRCCACILLLLLQQQQQQQQQQQRRRRRPATMSRTRMTILMAQICPSSLLPRIAAP